MPITHRRLSLLALLACAALVTTTSVITADDAVAKKPRVKRINHVGTVDEMPEARVTFTVLKRGRKITKVVNVRFTGYKVLCSDGVVGDGVLNWTYPLVSPTFPNLKVTRGLGVTGFGMEETAFQLEGYDNAYRSILGELRRGGRSASGEVSVRWYNEAGDGCYARHQQWRTQAG